MMRRIALAATALIVGSLLLSWAAVWTHSAALDWLSDLLFTLGWLASAALVGVVLSATRRRENTEEADRG